MFPNDNQGLVIHLSGLPKVEDRVPDLSRSKWRDSESTIHGTPLQRTPLPNVTLQDPHADGFPSGWPTSPQTVDVPLKWSTRTQLICSN